MKTAREMRLWNKARSDNQKGGIDEFDLQAEAEGDARRFFKTHEVGPKILGRRISKETRQADGREKTAGARAIRHIVKETADRAAQIIVKRV